MPDRIIRDELLTSERYWSVSDESKLLYIHLLLCADDTARYTGKNFSLRTKCFAGHPMDAERMEYLLTELVNQDLIRLYESGQERFVFIPRFRQRLRFTNSKFPEPPKDIGDLQIKKTDLSKTKDGLKSDSRQAQDSRSEVKRSEEKKQHTSSLRFDDFWSAYPKCKRKGSKQKCIEKWKGQKLDTHADEILSHVRSMATSDDWTKQNGQFIPAPLSYITQARWDGAEPDNSGSDAQQVYF